MQLLASFQDLSFSVYSFRGKLNIDIKFCLEKIHILSRLSDIKVVKFQKKIHEIKKVSVSKEDVGLEMFLDLFSPSQFRELSNFSVITTCSQFPFLHFFPFFVSYFSLSPIPEASHNSFSL